MYSIYYCDCNLRSLFLANPSLIYEYLRIKIKFHKFHLPWHPTQHPQQIVSWFWTSTSTKESMMYHPSSFIKNHHPHVISSSILPVLPEPLHVSAPRLLSTRRAPLHWAPRHQPAVGPSTLRTRRPPRWLVGAARCPAGSVWPWVSAQWPPAAVQTIYTRRYLKLMDLVGFFFLMDCVLKHHFLDGFAWWVHFHLNFTCSFWGRMAARMAQSEIW